MNQRFIHKCCLVTGAAGFVGSHLCERLLQAGARVIGVDNFITGSQTNIELLAMYEQFVFIKADVTQRMESYMQPDQQIDFLFHFASPASPPAYQRFPVETYLVNSLGTHHVLEFVQQQQPHATVVYASTSEIYGDPLEHPQSETYWGNVNPNGPRACYDESKRLGETICGVFARDKNMDVRIVRIFNTYGPRIKPDDGRIISNFIVRSLRREQLVIYGDPQKTRSYCYVEDLVDGVLKLAIAEQGRAQTINLGNPDEHTLMETAELIWRQVWNDGSNPSIVFQPDRTDDPSKRRPNIDKAKVVLGWTPQTSFAEGLQKTIAYFKNNS